MSASDLAWLQANAKEDVKSETFESADPTSIEFERLFLELMDAALSGKRIRRMLLVVDNLDRVEPDAALAIWSTLQTFLQERIKSVPTWFSKLWVLVPYDRDALKKVWNLESSIDAGGRAANTHEHRDVAESFLDKRFQIRFQVPPLVLSDWKQYLANLVLSAMPQHADDAHEVYRVFNQLRPKEQEELIPKPRELKLFVNQIGALHRQWQDEIPLSHLAYYVLHHRKSNWLSALKTGQEPASLAVEMLGETLRAHLAGLTFNVVPRKGQELLLAAPIQQHLENYKVNELTALCDAHPDGFWPVLEIVAQNSISGLEPRLVATVAATLFDSAIAANCKFPEFLTTLSLIRGRVLQVQKWPGLDEELSQRLISLCKLLAEQPDTVAILQAIASSVKETKEGSGAINSLKGLIRLLPACQELGHLDNATDLVFELNVTPAQWFTFCHSTVPETSFKEYLKFIRPIAEWAEVSSVIIAEINQGTFGPQHIQTLKLARLSKWNVDLSSVVDALAVQLEVPQNVAPNVAVTFTKTLNALRRMAEPQVADKLKSLVDSGHLLHHYSRVPAGPEHDGDRALFEFIHFRDLVRLSHKVLAY